VRGTTNPAPCCHLANDTDLLTPVLWAMAGDNKQIAFGPPTRLPELTQNLTRLSHGHSKPSLKISCKSVQPFSRNVADKETKKERKKKERNRPITIPRPPTGGGVKMRKKFKNVKSDLNKKRKNVYYIYTANNTTQRQEARHRSFWVRICWTAEKLYARFCLPTAYPAA